MFLSGFVYHSFVLLALCPGSTLDCIVSSMDEWLLDFTQQRDHLGHDWHPG